MIENFLAHLNLILMIIFIFFYSVLVFFRNSKSGLADFFRNIVYMGSGMLFVYYIFQISYLSPYKEFEYLVIFLIALSFRDLLPVIVDFTVDVATTKLKQLDNKIKGTDK
tara:strand:+ start:555 stop:884 length:330 start_codon:yes stop_codon:yes gene_type:complete